MFFKSFTENSLNFNLALKNLYMYKFYKKRKYLLFSFFLNVHAFFTILFSLL
jgi:hypothetical protein